MRFQFLLWRCELRLTRYLVFPFFPIIVFLAGAVTVSALTSTLAHRHPLRIEPNYHPHDTRHHHPSAALSVVPAPLDGRACLKANSTRAACLAHLQGSRAPGATSAPGHVFPVGSRPVTSRHDASSTLALSRSAWRRTASFERHQGANCWVLSIMSHGRERKVVESVTSRGKIHSGTRDSHQVANNCNLKLDYANRRRSHPCSLTRTRGGGQLNHKWHPSDTVSHC